MDYLLSAVLHALPESTSPSFADLNPVLNRDVIDPQVPLLEQLNHLVDDQPAHSVAAELVISQTPVLRQINDLFSAKQGLRFETPKAKLRKKKGV
jgi:hypothetical protein